MIQTTVCFRCYTVNALFEENLSYDWNAMTGEPHLRTKCRRCSAFMTLTVESVPEDVRERLRAKAEQ
jgi:hypothetical protein